MAASSKRTGPRESSSTYLRASRYREELADEARTLRRAGKIRAAKGIENRVQQVEQLLGALEGESPTRATPSQPTQ